MARIERPKSLTETVLEHLRERIVSGDLKLGAPLSERALAESLDVSKTPVREALAQLKTEGLVTIVPQRGASVFTLGAREILEICEFRLAIESTALRLSVDRNREALVAEMARIVASMRDAHAAGHIRQYLRLDTEFHAAFFRHCDNNYLRDSYERYVGKIAALRTHLAAKPKHTKLSLQEHEELLTACKDGDKPAISRILSAHIERTSNTYAADIDDIATADTRDSNGN